MHWPEEGLHCAYAHWFVAHVRPECRRWEHVKCDLGLAPGREQCRRCPHKLNAPLLPERRPAGGEPGVRGSTIYPPRRSSPQKV